jgi:hypothetical protein
VLGQIACMYLMRSGVEFYITNIEVINKNSNRSLQYESNENDGGLWFHKEEESKGEKLMDINPTYIPKLFYPYV